MDEFGVPNFTVLGSNVLVLDLGRPYTLEKQRRIWRLHAGAPRWSGVIESVPGLNNLTLLVDDGADTRPLQQACLDALREPADESLAANRSHLIPVRYGGHDGPDLQEVAASTGLSEDMVVARHCGVAYHVYFVGFQPGFAYLGDLDDALAVPRRAQPRARVPAGSVAIGGTQTGIYPFASPGGWNIIGRTESTLFDARREPAALFAPGDIVRFVPA